MFDEPAGTRGEEASGSEPAGAQWMPVADLMSGLMLIFMILAIVFARSVVNEQTVAEDECGQARTALRDRLQDRLAVADALMEPDGSVVFQDPDTMFPAGSAVPRPELIRTLEWFVPAYTGVLHGLAGAGNPVNEIRIEGHTSSEWTAGTPADEAYLLNMELSQDRTRAILDQFMRILEPGSAEREWARRRLTANGLSSLELKYTNGVEDAERSRRVEFRAVIDSCERAGMFRAD